MTTFEAPNPDFESFVKSAVRSMPSAVRLGFEFGPLRPGSAEIVQPCHEDLTQHDGHVQGGVLGMLADFAGGMAAATLLPVGWLNMTADYTVKIVAPAAGESLIARGRVVDAGRSTTVAAADVYAVASEEETLCATALVTMRNVKMPSKSETTHG